MPTPSSDRQIPEGFRCQQELRGHEGVVTRFSWSPDGETLVSSSADKTVRLWNARTGELIRTIPAHDSVVWTVAWSPDGEALASAAEDKTIRIWNPRTGEQIAALRKHASAVYSLAWSPDGRILASGSADYAVGIWDCDAQRVTFRTALSGHWTGVNSVIWSPDGKLLASGSHDTRILLRESERLSEVLHTLTGHLAGVNNLAWSPDGRFLASGSDDMSIRLWDPMTGRELRTLEGHTGRISRISFSANGRLLASKSNDGTVRLWRCDTWKEATELVEPPDPRVLQEETLVWRAGLAFHLKQNLLAALDRTNRVINIWQVDTDLVLSTRPVRAYVNHTSAKIVLLGESNVGKTCLAKRLAEDKYEEQPSTHGMRFWTLAPETLHPSCAPPPGERREVVIWDMGGQSEYRLLHQLFLEDTTLALVFLDPQRGVEGFDEVEGWVQRLEKQHPGKIVTKLLVGSRMDEENAMFDRARVGRLVEKCGFVGFFETSAKSKRGIDALRSAIARHLDWEAMTKTSRDPIFQLIREEIARLRKAGEVVLLLSDLEGTVRAKQSIGFDSRTVEAVVKQLTLQGLIAVTRLANGERALVLDVGEIERYGGSLIVAARDNLRGVPAVELRRLGTPLMSFPSIKENERLPPTVEKTVVECIVQLLLEKGVCLEHERLLIFPSLFRSTQTGRPEPVPHAISLYYDFTGAIDNIYASLVAWLALCGEFGRMRLWVDRAEFEKLGQGECGSRKQEVRSGFAHLDVYFSSETPRDLRDFFVVLIEEHLRQHGVQISERIEVTCTCGYCFPENTIRLRIANGQMDIGCPECDRRTMISEGAKTARLQDPNRIVAVKTKVERNRKKSVEEAKATIQSWDPEQPAEPIRVLHLSDLHISKGDNPEVLIQPLLQDLRTSESLGGFGLQRLSGLVISGDLTNTGHPEELEKAGQFVSLLLNSFNLSAQRCVIVPGNHDVDWKIPVYDYEFCRLGEPVPKADFRTVIAGDIVFSRNGEMYPQRFRNFSRYLFHPLTQQEYPLDYAAQGMSFLFDGAGVQLLSFNSCWEIDKFFPHRSSICPDAMARLLLKADDQLEISKVALHKSAAFVGRSTRDGTTSVLRIAVWHHPVTGNEKITDDAFLNRLARAHVALCLHGHVHELRPALVNYVHPATKLDVAGTGSFGAPSGARPPSTPRLYSLLEIPLNHQYIRIHTRCQLQSNGTWEGWAVWPGAGQTERRTYYEIPVDPQRLVRVSL